MKLYRSVSVSNILEANKVINKIKNRDYVFISLHNQEEVDKNYIQNTSKICEALNNKGAYIIADISKRSLSNLKCKNLTNLKKKLGIYAFRFDYGFSIDEIIKYAKNNPVVVNASTITESELLKIKKHAKKVIALFNFYPRKETAMDEIQFYLLTYKFKIHQIETFAFIKGDKVTRGPIHEGLVSVESHRNLSPSVSYILYALTNLVSGVFIGDLGLSKKEEDIIN